MCVIGNILDTYSHVYHIGDYDLNNYLFFSGLRKHSCHTSVSGRKVWLNVKASP